MAAIDQLSTEDLLRIFLMKFIATQDVTTWLNGQFVNGDIVTANGTSVNTAAGT